jgi:hypothetical protein
MKLEDSFIYTGASMLGTFCPGDRLTIMPTAAAEIRRGDIIAFESRSGQNGQPAMVVHRVWAKSTAGFVTKGDSNVNRDRMKVTPSQIKGRVAYRISSSQKHRVHNGKPGFIWAQTLNLWNHTKRSLRLLLRIPYQWLKGTQIIARLWRPQINQVIIQSGSGRIIKFIHKRRVIGYFWPDRKRIVIKKPYDLVIKVAADPE